jgi:hypothetical protein
MIVVFFTPRDDDPLSGPITECVEAPEAVIGSLRRPYRVVADRRDDWDFTHEVVGGEVVARDPAVLNSIAEANAVRRLRARRDSLLRDLLDPVVSNPLRWSALSSDQQATVGVYRLALLDWPATEVDPLNPTEPPVPEFL